MATPHYPQPGPSSIPYPLPHPYALGGNLAYHVPHQASPNTTMPPQPPNLVHGVGRATYPTHQGSRPGSAFHPHFPPHQTYQPNFYHYMDRLPNARSTQAPSYPPQRLPNGPLGRPPPGQGQYVHANAQRHHPPNFSLTHNQFYPRSPPGASTSALPKQLLMPPPVSPLPSQTSTNFPADNVRSSPTSDAQSSESKQHDSHQLFVPPSPSSASSQPLPPVQHPSSPCKPSDTYEASSSRALSPKSPASSRVETSEPPISEAFDPPAHQPSESVASRAFPDRTNIVKGLALLSQRPAVSEAVPFTVSSAARPPPSYYDSICREHVQEKVYLGSPKSNNPPLNPSPGMAAACINNPDDPKTLPQESLASSTSTATTPATSTAPHTPTPGSPNSSMTSLSPPTKSPSDLTLDVLPSPSPKVLTANIQSPATEVVPLPPVQQPPASSIEPTPSLPSVKKTWASLLRPSSNELSNAGWPTKFNSLPVSSVQGFSIPASPSAAQSTSSTPRPHSDLVTLLTVPNPLAGQMPRIRARGIINLGNMCFANTVLQFLVYCPPFNRLFTQLENYLPSSARKEIRMVDGMGTPLVNATVTFIAEFQTTLAPDDKSEEQDHESNGKESFVPNYVYEALKETKRFDSMRGGQQEDAEEFLGFYLDTLEEELLSLIKNSSKPTSIPEANLTERLDGSHTEGWLEVGKKNKTVVTRTHKMLESPISRIFGGQVRTTLKVPGARETVMIDPWSRLQLDIQPDHIHSIEDALRNIATPGTVHVTSSSRPDIQVDATQQTLIETLPPILVLHLKRFLYDTTANDVVKLSKKVAFRTELEIPNDVMAPTQRSRPMKYKLFGVLNHHGSSATGGHYTLDVLHPDRNGCEGWIRIDDEFIQDIRVEDLPVKDLGDDRSAYLLFFRRVHPSGPGARM